VPVLTGAIIFVADLMRQLPHKMRLSVVTVSSYRGRTSADESAMLVGELPEDIRARHALIVDDILDSGRTIRLLRQRMLDAGAASVRTCVLLRKQNPAAMGTPCEYVGFDIPDAFVVGYGLDYDNYYRNLPDVGTLKREAM
jgi:hypoxanthine phosphoribosyltransferase